MKHQNLFDKYDINAEDFAKAIEQGVDFGKIVNFKAVLALADLITNGDINQE
jgi:hypothetical protein